MSKNSTVEAGRDFEVEANEVTRNLRAAFLDILHDLDAPIHRATDLERALGLRTTLAWQVFRVATAESPLAIGPYIPGIAAVNQLVRAARAADVTEPTLARVESAMSAFESLIKHHAGDRGVLLSMLGSLAGDEGQPIDPAARRQAFRANSQLWGVNVKSLLWCMVWHRSRDESVIDNVSVRGLHEIRRLRRGSLFSVSSRRAKDCRGKLWEPQSLEPEQPQEPFGPNLLVDFCSKPCPKLINRLEDGFVESYLDDAPLGNAGAQSLYVSDMIRDFKWRADESSSYLYSNVAVRKPAEVLVLDCLVHRGMFGNVKPEVTVYGSLQRLGEADRTRFHPEEVLPMEAEIRSLGAGRAILPTPHIPQYAEMIESVCERVGWDVNEFDVFRCVIEYPILSSLISVRFELPE